MKNLFNFDYNKSITSFTASILKYYHIDTKCASLEVLDKAFKENFKNIVLLILDGLGLSLLKKNLSPDSFLRMNLVDTIFSVFPSTTAAATISYHSGLTPLESGWIGWACYYPGVGKIVENFTNTSYETGEKLNVPANEQIAYQTIYEKIVKCNPQVEYIKIFPAFEPNGCVDFDQMCSRIECAVSKNSNPKLISAYWTEPDHTAHLNGTSSVAVSKTLQEIDLRLQKMAENLKDTLVIISADHGLIDVQEVYIDDYPKLYNMLKIPPCLESRFVTFYVKENFRTEFPILFNEIFGRDFKLYTTQEFLNTGLLGYGKKHCCIDDFLGDFVAIASSDKAICYHLKNRVSHPHKADHAGLSKEEMEIPLIIKKCYG